MREGPESLVRSALRRRLMFSAHSAINVSRSPSTDRSERGLRAVSEKPGDRLEP